MMFKRIFPLSGGGLGVAELTVPKAKLEGDIDPEPYRLRASGVLPALPSNRPFIPVDEVRGIVLKDCEDDIVAALDGEAHVLFVASGWLELARHDELPVRFNRGDLVLIEESADCAGYLRHDEGTRLVAFRMAGDWPAEGEPLRRDENEVIPTTDLNMRSMRQAGEASYFTGFDQLFQIEKGSCNEPRATHGIYFAEAKDGTFIDMHPEVQTNLVLVLAGVLELEVSGNPATEHFRAGDVVLAADRTGEGHIDRFHGRTTLLAATMVEDDPWPLAE